MASSESLSSAWDSGQEDPSGHRNRRSRHLRKTRVSPQMHTLDGSEPMTAMGPDAVRAASIVRSSVCDNCSVSEKGMSSGTVSPVLGLENAEGTRAGINGQSKRVVVPPLVGKGGTALGSTGEPARNGPSETASTAPPSLARLLRALAPTVWGRGERGAGVSMDLVSGHSKLGNRNKVQALLVEDSLTIQKVMRHYFENNDCVVTVAPDGEKGLQLMKEGGHDLIFTDFVMVSVFVLSKLG